MQPSGQRQLYRLQCIVRLAELAFVDLHLGADYRALTQVVGKPNPWEPGQEFEDEFRELRAACEQAYKDLGDPEFPLTWEGMLYRVTMFKEAKNTDLYVLRKSQINLRPITDLGFRQEFINYILAEDASGLILVVGGMARGKTTTAASIAATRIGMLGGIGWAMEDPQETPLEGKIGRGRFVQVWVRARYGGYRGAIHRAMRSGASLLYLGEIRDESSAQESLLVSANGTFSVATMHAAGVAEALQRLEGRLEANARLGARELMATGLRAIVYQDLVRPQTGVVIPKHQILVLDDNDASIKAKIRKGDYVGIQDDVKRQTEHSIWAGQHP